MCRRVTCPNCQKPSWKGCGAHVEQVLGDVPVADRCACGAAAARPPLLSKLLRR
jgi:RNase P subunit RPR2